MTAAEDVVAILMGVAILLLCLAFAVGPRRRSPEPAPPELDRLLEERLRDRFVVTLTTGDSFDGLLWDVDEKTLVLEDVAVFRQDGERTPVDGQVVLRRDSVAYMQRV